MRISVEEARKYLEHPSQQKGCDALPTDLPEEGVEYWAKGGICGMFHTAQWPNVWQAHYAVMPSQWGKLVQPAKDVLMEFWEARQPSLILAFTDEQNRAALAFAKRIGFKPVGNLAPTTGGVLISEWKPWESEQQLAAQ